MRIFSGTRYISSKMCSIRSAPRTTRGVLPSCQRSTIFSGVAGKSLTSHGSDSFTMFRSNATVSPWEWQDGKWNVPVCCSRKSSFISPAAV